MNRLMQRSGETVPNGTQEAEPMPVPAAAYCYSRTPLNSPYRPEEGARIRARSSVVDRRPRRGGWSQSYSYGTTNMWEQIGTPMRATGQVNDSCAQPHTNLLQDWFINQRWYEAGYPAASVMNGGLHNLGITFRVPGLTNVNGGTRWSSMVTKPQFDRVQNVPRYSATPLAYNTRSATI